MRSTGLPQTRRGKHGEAEPLKPRRRYKSSALKLRRKRANKSRPSRHLIKTSWGDWCEESLVNGASRAHAWTKVPELWRPEAVADNKREAGGKTAHKQALADAEANKWGER